MHDYILNLNNTVLMAELPAGIKRSQEFFDFLKTFGIIGLAIAFVIGQARLNLLLYL